MRWSTAVLVLSFVGLARSQEAGGGHPKHEPEAAVHAPHPSLPPTAALDHLRRSNAAVVARGRSGQPPAPPFERPAGAGRFVASVVTCAELPADLPHLLGLRAEDLLVIRNAGGTCDADVRDLVAWAAATERLSLCIVLTHQPCACVPATPTAAAANTDATAQPLDRGAAARALAARRQLQLARAQAIVQAEQLLGAAPLLRTLADRGEFRVVGASLDAVSGAVDWHLSRADDLPIAPVR